MPSFINPGTKSYTTKTTLDPVNLKRSDLEIQYGRVVDVILDSTHPRYDSLGRSQALYGVFYQPLFVRAEEDLSSDYNLRFAYCKQNPLRQVPVKNEIVELEVGPATAGVQARDDEGFKYNVYQDKVYWTSIVPVWNHPHLNIYPDVVKFEGEKEEVDLGKDFVEDASIQPLQLSSGDVVLEGRHGQSLRMGGTKSSNGLSLSDAESNGKPYTILRNGQAPTQGNVCVEDINKDDSSIYLTSDHGVPLLEANRKFAAAKKAPEPVRDYKGKQILVNSDRVVLNAREDNLTLAAKKHLGENAKTVSIDGEDYIGLDADKVYLGSYAQKEVNPVLKGQETVDLLKEAFDTINNFLQTLATAPNETYSWVATAKTAANVTLISLQSTLARIDSLKSKKVYTE